MLGTSVASVNSALQRARATLDDLALDDASTPVRPGGEDERRLLEQYLEAFAEYDIDRIVSLLHHDAVFDMPPLPLWLRGAPAAGRFMLGPGSACRGSRLIAVTANGCPAFASYKPDPDSGDWLPWSVTLLEAEAADGGAEAAAPTVAGVHNFLAPLMPNLFASFGLPGQLGELDPTIATLDQLDRGRTRERDLAQRRDAPWTSTTRYCSMISSGSSQPPGRYQRAPPRSCRGPVGRPAPGRDRPGTCPRRRPAAALPSRFVRT